MTNLTASIFMLAFASAATFVSGSPTEYPVVGKTDFPEHKDDILDEVSNEEKSLINNSIISRIKKCICSILSTGELGILMENMHLADALQGNPNWIDLSSLTQQIEKLAEDNGPEYVYKFYNGTNQQAMSPLDILHYIENVIKKCFLNKF